MSTCLIACSVFADALTWLEFEGKFPGVTVRYLPAYLHLRPIELKNRLVAEVRYWRRKDCNICCLYGYCFPDIDAVLADFAAPRLPVNHCFEILLGADRYREIISAQPGTFFVEKQLLLNFDAYCWIPLELDDTQLREAYFKNYRQVTYIRQPLDPDLTRQANEIAGRLNLCLQIADADYRELDLMLTRILREISTP